MQRAVKGSILLLALYVLGAAAQPRTSRPGPSGTPDIVISERNGCGPGPYLTANMQDCVVDDLMGSNGTLAIGFSVDPKAAKKHGVLLTLRSVGGAAVMRVWPPGMGMYSGRVVYFNDAVTESILRIPPGDVEGGDYTIVIQGMGGATQKLLVYLRLQTPPANVRLAPAEKAAMQAIWRTCCPVTKGLEAPDVCSTFLPNAFKATKVEDDLCNTMGFVCNGKGQLEKIDFSNAGLKCPSFPPQFGQFPALETLMLRFNNFNEDTFENVADVLSSATNLRRLMMGNTNITGRVPCRLFEEHTLKTVMFSVNQLEGDLPDCVLQHSSLEELYMSRLPLTGSLPDTIPEDSNLIVWYAINRDPITNKPAGPGFSGPLPKSLGNAKNLAFVELSGHQLTGGVPALPEKLRMFEVHNNKLDGGVESPLPDSLIYLDLSNNSLTGPVPDFSAAKDLTLLDMAQNQLTGQLPSSFGAAGDKLVYMDLSRNKLSGDINAGTTWETMPALQYLFLQGNELEGAVPASLGGNKKLVALNMAYNRLGGNLEAFGDAITPASKVSPQQAAPSTSTSSSTKGGRKLAAFSSSSRHTAAAAAVDPAAASLALSKKLLGTREDWSIYQPGQAVQQYFTLDTQSLEALATGEAHTAGRRLMQAVTSTPTVGGATTSTVQRPPVTTGTAKQPDAPTTSTVSEPEPEPELDPTAPEDDAEPEPDSTTSDEPDTPTSSSSAPTTTTTTTSSTKTSRSASEPPITTAPAVEPTPPASSSSSTSRPLSTGPSSSSSSAVPTVSAVGPPRGRPMPDMAFIAPPTRSALAGNSFLYLNLSNNDIEGAIPESMGNLEMFRSPANSTDPFDMYVFSRGGPDRTLDLTYNKLYGEFPAFLVKQAADLPDSCLCTTNFTVSDGNQLYCPTKASLAGAESQLTPNLLDTFRQANYTCLMPNQKEPVSLEKYLSAPSDYITQVPSQSELPAPEPKVARTFETPASSSGSSYGASSRQGGGKSGMGPGEIAGIVVGAVAGVGILGALAYFVGYKKLYKTHKATSYKRGEIPDGPMLDGAGAYPAAAYGAGGAANGSHLNPDAVPVSSGPPRA